MVTDPIAMISAGDAGPDVTLLINDSGGYVLRTRGQDIEVDGGLLAEALARSGPVAALVARSKTPISGISAPVERMLTRFGCTLDVAGQPAASPSEVQVVSLHKPKEG